MWRFATHVYPSFKNELLRWQNSQQLNVNDLLALAFALKHQSALPEHWWLDPTLVRLRCLTHRVRSIRLVLKGKPSYPQAKAFELGLEALDIERLAQLLQPGDCTMNIALYENRAGIEKGAIAPFIQRLSDY